MFRDITPLLANPAALSGAISAMTAAHTGDVDIVAGVEARGFIFGAAIADAIGAGFVPIRKPGKLPADTVSRTYDLEYGTDTLEMHADAVSPGTRVLLVDDVLATGGTATAARELVASQGADVVGLTVLVELAGLNGRQRLDGCTVNAVVSYD
ncbi:UNVERIFIED_CONTAM: hypothetical protein GTU68_003228 [Idotea baltica]|nr:hypothetical protein [Idotea baltica]